MTTTKRTHDTRVSEIIARAGNAHLFPELDIPAARAVTVKAVVVRFGQATIA